MSRPRSSIRSIHTDPPGSEGARPPGVRVHLYGRFRRFAPRTAVDGESTVLVPVEGAETIRGVVERLGIDTPEVAHAFLNGEYSAISRPVRVGDRLGIFPREMGLLYRQYFPRGCGQMVEVQVRLYAFLRELVRTSSRGVTGGAGALLIQVERGASIGDLLEVLWVPPALVALTFVNGVRRDRDYVLADGDRVGLFPAIAGGGTVPQRPTEEA